jgi:hypothetical protein
MSVTPTHRRLRVVGVATSAALIGSAIGFAPVAADGHAPIEHLGSFFVTSNLAEGEDKATPTSAEIVDVTPDGSTIVYSDGVAGRVGFVDISDPADPQPLGAIEVSDPTSVALHEGLVLVGSNTSEDFVNPSGELLVIDLESRETVATLPLSGQPDAVAVAPSGTYAAIAIENERDEDLDGGLIPQLPAGTLDIIDLTGEPSEWTVRQADLTGLAATAPDDPEPEFVDINALDQAVVTLQENNHIAIVDLDSGEIVNHFSAGTVDLDGIDLTEEEVGPQENGFIEFAEAREGIRREPDAVKWIDDDSFATANEGDYEDADGEEGGSRGFTIFNVDGTVEYDSGTGFEYAVASAGHYPEGRSGNKGAEPEGLAVGSIDGADYLFVASERGNIVAAYELIDGQPSLAGLLPTGMGPEGLVVTDDGPLVVTAEVDGFDEDPDDQFGVRSLITLYGAGDGSKAYPQLISAPMDEAGTPIPWVAISGMSGDPEDPNTVWAVSDSFLAQPWIYRIDVSSSPATITERIAAGAAESEDQLLGEYDLEGIAARPEGGFWLASEGRVSEGSSRPNLIVRVEADGTVVEGIPLPDAAVDVATNSGLEGVAVTGTEAAGDETVWVVQQRPWDNDAEGTVKVGKYDIASGEWTFAAYPLDAPESSAGGWVGLSEITVVPGVGVAIVERDNQLGEEAAIKRVYGIDPASVEFVPAGEELPLLEKTLLRDLLPDLDAASISIPDKIESLAVTADGTVYIATDNDGVDENYGETVFISLGTADEAFGS